MFIVYYCYQIHFVYAVVFLAYAVYQWYMQWAKLSQCWSFAHTPYNVLYNNPLLPSGGQKIKKGQNSIT